jgi:hypothetical protein
MIEDWKKTRFGPAVLSVPCEGENLFIQYHHWLRYRKVGTKSSYLDLIKLYSFGDFLQDAVYHDVVMSAIIEKLSNSNATNKKDLPGLLSPAFVTELYSKTGKDSPLRKLVVYVMTCAATEQDWVRLEETKGLPTEFLYAMASSAGRTLVRAKKPQAQPKRKRVTFWDDAKTGSLTFLGTSEEETECSYHNPTKAGNPCWRSWEEFCP